jgi:hypothetical protein
MNLIALSGIVFIVNVPFGYWRANTKKFSRDWFLSVHIPVPIVIALRIFTGIGWHFITFPVLIGSFFLGQFFGSVLLRWIAKYARANVSSCLFLDLIKIINTFLGKNKA